MFKINFECRIVAEDESVGYFMRRVVTGRDFYSFLITITSAISQIMAEAASYKKVIEKEEMEKNSELPF